MEDNQIDNQIIKTVRFCCGVTNEHSKHEAPVSMKRNNKFYVEMFPDVLKNKINTVQNNGSGNVVRVLLVPKELASLHFQNKLVQGIDFETYKEAERVVLSKYINPEIWILNDLFPKIKTELVYLQRIKTEPKVIYIHEELSNEFLISLKTYIFKDLRIKKNYNLEEYELGDAKSNGKAKYVCIDEKYESTYRFASGTPIAW